MWGFIGPIESDTAKNTQNNEISQFTILIHLCGGHLLHRTTRWQRRTLELSLGNADHILIWGSYMCLTLSRYVLETFNSQPRQKDVIVRTRWGYVCTVCQRRLTTQRLSLIAWKSDGCVVT